MQYELRDWKLEYAEDLAGVMNNKNVLDTLRDGIPYPYTRADAEEFIRGLLVSDPKATFAYAIFADGQLCGSISVVRQGNIHFRTGELGYCVAEPFWNRGVGTNAVKQICQFVFTNSDILRIFAEPFSYNAASCRILEKNGFQYEGTLRKNAVKNGKILDMKLYARLK